MTCDYGSRKKSGAVDFININQIGALCFLFGLEGDLCRLLDLVPNAIKQIASLNPDIGNADQVFGKILKKVATKAYQIAIDDDTNQISVEQFCSVDAPPEPYPITYEDVFKFISELVPILNYFFKVNDVLSGENTSLLVKIVGVWLRSKWFENCECIPKPIPPDQPPPDNSVVIPVEPDPVLCPPDANGNQKQRSRNLQLTNIDPVTGNRRYSCTSFYNCGGTNISSKYGFVRLPQFGVWVAKEFKSVSPDRFDVFSLVPGTPYTYLSHECLLANDFGLWWRQGNGAWTYFNGDTSIFDGLPFDPCPNPIPENKDDFCALFPDDPMCVPPNEDYCSQINIPVVEFVSCDIPVKKPTRRVLRNSGVDESITVDEWTSCGNRTPKQVTLFKCDPPVYGCTDPSAPNYNPLANIDDGSCAGTCESYQSQVEAFAVNLAQNGKIYDGTLRPYRQSDLGSALANISSLPFYYSATGCYQQFRQYFTDAWNNYFNPVVTGCTDPSAINYNPLATVDDGSCIFDDFDCSTLQEQYTTWGTNDATYYKSIGADMPSELQSMLDSLATGSDYTDHPKCSSQFNQWYTDAWNAVADSP
ncbi:hypothetical protein [Pseudanabaena sp. 'Roaring Creek']|uniref:hypothetical protein n=1 Tax=Pseudanabaena sp. 'Roaring Creek' TaxID=1681830 RepID=UPI0006D8635F|nr:hypothetical protein [Pseudanabaena sp. 'Roaring Creek']